jgi:multimeric flavodoxin WrbA
VVVFLSRIVYGGYSYDVKSFLDRTIANISPFFEIVHDEMRHKMRYKRFPCMVSIGYGKCSPQERATFINLTERNAMNMRPPKHFAFTMQNAEEVEATIQALKNVLSQRVSQ